jgi:Zn-dependent peptidase ImmA (M78 family)
MRSFGYFEPGSKKIWVFAGNRIMADVFRTLAHELIHRKQEEDGKIQNDSGETGSEIENEANSLAGVILREFGKQYEEIYINPIQNLKEIKVATPFIPIIKTSFDALKKH